MVAVVARTKFMTRSPIATKHMWRSWSRKISGWWQLKIDWLKRPTGDLRCLRLVIANNHYKSWLNQNIHDRNWRRLIKIIFIFRYIARKSLGYVSNFNRLVKVINHYKWRVQIWSRKIDYWPNWLSSLLCIMLKIHWNILRLKTRIKI